MKKTLLILLSILVVLFAFVACEDSVDYVLDNEPAPGPGPGPGPSPVHVTSVSLNKTELILEEGDNETLTATVLPSDATNKKVTWTSNKPAVATVDANGKVTGVAAGTATITVTTEDGEKTATCAVTVKADAKTIPLTLEFPTAGTVTITITGDPGTVRYSVNDGEKTEAVSGTPIEVPANGKISLYRTLGVNLDDSNYFTIACSADCYVYGNLMSLIDESNFKDLTTISYEFAFRSLFIDNSFIKNHESIDLVLPATTMAYKCCYCTFSGCENLTKAPVLSAETVANYCYQYMFSHCTSLTTAPALPAETLADGCYYGMFYDCTSLATAPTLPATTLAYRCYEEMFWECTSLATAPALPATTLAVDCYDSMFRHCTSLTTAPTLPATTLTDRCYYKMFYDCTSLNSITCLATSLTGSYPTDNWVYHVAATGTFKTPAGTGWTVDSTSGIPAGWTRQTP